MGLRPRSAEVAVTGAPGEAIRGLNAPVRGPRGHSEATAKPHGSAHRGSCRAARALTPAATPGLPAWPAPRAQGFPPKGGEGGSLENRAFLGHSVRTCRELRFRDGLGGNKLPAGKCLVPAYTGTSLVDAVCLPRHSCPRGPSQACCVCTGPGPPGPDRPAQRPAVRTCAPCGPAQPSLATCGY